MTTYLTQLMNELDGPKIGEFYVNYFRERFRGQVNDELVEALEENGMKKADVARKLDRRPEQITRWLSAPCNLEMDSLSDIALALGLVPTIRLIKIGDERSNNDLHSFIKLSGRTDVTTGMGSYVYDQANQESKLMIETSSQTNQSAKKLVSIGS